MCRPAVVYRCYDQASVRLPKGKTGQDKAREIEDIRKLQKTISLVQSPLKRINLLSSLGYSKEQVVENGNPRSFMVTSRVIRRHEINYDEFNAPFRTIPWTICLKCLRKLRIKTTANTNAGSRHPRFKL